ncbi:hypothetical protein H0A36_00460 [Endozoicomonas sp. SM1973]|uniref:Mor transcription activator domain-containing protein n=1 Tax=Spartinivicinus marinus TaxID=2994442 RepID=A0A853IAK2_9GAMM|nr:hypothetical protein [Spartinivicinus marinus]MCX4026622.1 hypothetical protein [Spartinivicinus marinus]NYZ64456.1 hypothetical protein [Spartinivicinus marinus]
MGYTLTPQDLNGTLEELAQVIGVSAAIMLAQRMGGARVYIPETSREDHPIALAIGYDNAKKLSEKFPGEYLEIPSKSAFRKVRNKLICRLYIDGKTANAIAPLFGLTRRQVFNIVNEHKDYTVH